MSDEAILEAMSAWNGGDQDLAIEKLKPSADQGDPASLLLSCWYFSQLGVPRLFDGLPYAKRATEEGNPWPLQWFFSHLADDPSRRAEAAQLVAAHPLGAYNSNDPLGRAIQFAQDGEPDNAIAMLRATAGPHPWPEIPDADEIKNRLAQLNQAAASVGERKSSAESAIRQAEDDVTSQEQGFKTRAQTLTQLLDNLTNASSQSHFEQQAETYGRESRIIWYIGVGVLALATCVAFLPVVFNYFADSHELSGQSNVSAHLGATLALAALAGVLLARARNRDRDRQRNRDLSVALGTMFAYSEQIANEDARERFKHDMGRLVLETFLRQKPPSENGSRSILSEITDAATPKVPQSPE